MVKPVHGRALLKLLRPRRPLLDGANSSSTWRSKSFLASSVPSVWSKPTAAGAAQGARDVTTVATAHVDAAEGRLSWTNIQPLKTPSTIPRPFDMDGQVPPTATNMDVELPDVPKVTHEDLLAAVAASRAKVDAYIKEQNPDKALLVVDLDLVAANFSQLRSAMPTSRIFYAVKANPAPQILSLLASLGGCFDTASIPEIKMALAAGARPDQISFGNTIKKSADIKTAYDLGVRLFAFDSQEEMEKLAKHAPGASVFCRILTSGKGADWPLSRKFGCDPSMAQELLVDCPNYGLKPVGVSFHVGSQQRDVTQWKSAIEEAGSVFRYVADHGIKMNLLNLGGGFPTEYLVNVPTAQQIGDAIHSYMHATFGDEIPDMIIEPGRGMVGNAGSLVANVVLVARKSANDPVRWVFLDVGKFGGLAETMDECIHYPIETSRPNTATGPVIMAGPTCDSADVLYEKKQYQMPLGLAEGDRLVFRSTGAYTTTYSAVGFNGFSPLEAKYI